MNGVPSLDSAVARVRVGALSEGLEQLLREIDGAELSVGRANNRRFRGGAEGFVDFCEVAVNIRLQFFYPVK
jgi:hypothetical protein